MKNEFLWNMGDVLDSMRLLAEGAVVLFEEDTLPLTRLAKEHDELMAGGAFNTIGEAMYRLRTLIRELQEAHVKEAYRQAAEDNEDAVHCESE